MNVRLCKYAWYKPSGRTDPVGYSSAGFILKALEKISPAIIEALEREVYPAFELLMDEYFGAIDRLTFGEPFLTSEHAPGIGKNLQARFEKWGEPLRPTKPWLHSYAFVTLGSWYAWRKGDRRPVSVFEERPAPVRPGTIPDPRTHQPITSFAI